MNDSAIGIALLALAIGLTVGWFGALTMRRRESRRIRKLEEELEKARARVIEKTREHETYREEVNAHFQKTAELFHGLTEQYRAVYLHLAHSAQHLVGEQPPALQADMQTTERLVQSPAPAMSSEPGHAGAAAETGKPSASGETAAPSGPDTAERRESAQESEEEIVGDAPLVPELKRRKSGSDRADEEEAEEKLRSPAP